MASKILGVGISRTGTTSLSAALNLLGFSCVHSPEPWLIEQAAALVDQPAACRFRELDVLYPASKFILTVRDRESWLESCRKHWEKVSLDDMAPVARFEYGWCRVKLYGRTEFEPDNHWRAYERHFAEVRQYFADRPNDLLTMNVIAGEGWERLCAFLGVPIPPIAFPWQNRATAQS